MAHVIAVLNPKGGSGKSTLATNLARALQLAERSVQLVDADAQGTAIDWKAQEPEGLTLPDVVQARDAGTLERQVAAARFVFDVVVIDGAARAEKVVGAALEASDLVLMPVRPSPADLWGVEDLVREVKRKDKLAAFVITQETVGTRLASDVDEALADYGLPVLNGRLPNRIAYPNAMARGMSVLDYEPEGKAAEDVRAIRDEILEALED